MWKFKCKQQKKNDAMEVGDIEDLPKLFISPAEKFMDNFPVFGT